MYTDIRKAVLECGHCVLTNNVSHKAQQILGALDTDEPFDVISIDLWIPGATTKRIKDMIDSGEAVPRKAAMTGVCNLTGFAGVALVDALETGKPAQVLFGFFIVPNGFPKLILIDRDSLFGNLLKAMLDELGIAYFVVSPEQHEGILCERFH